MMRKFFKSGKLKTKHGSIWIRIDEKAPDEFVVDISSSSFFVTKRLENDFKNVLKNYLSNE